MNLRAITPESVLSSLHSAVSPDGRLVVATDGNRYWLYPIEGGEPHPIPNMESNQNTVFDQRTVLGWNDKGDSLYVSTPSEYPKKVYLLNPFNGHKELWKEITLSDPAGIQLPFAPVIAPNGKTYAYSYERNLSELFMIEGLK